MAVIIYSMEGLASPLLRMGNRRPPDRNLAQKTGQ